jgi:putative phosphoribosyl transferase
METARKKEINWRVKDMAVRIPAGPVALEADLTVPPDPRGVVVFAHGSGSGRHSPRNRAVAETLNARHFATLLVDLLTEEEEKEDIQTRRLRFDIPALAGRLGHAAAWLDQDPDLGALRIGWFGASIGAGAALIAAANLPEKTIAVVSRGGRPDLVGDALSRVSAPVLLIAGENDPQVLNLNRQALERLNDRSRLEIVPGASHLFEEPGALEEAARLTADWFDRYA